MRIIKRWALAVFALAALAAFGHFFMAQLTAGRSSTGPAGVVLSPPDDVPVEELGKASRSEAASKLTTLLSRSLTATRLAVHFYPDDERELYWIVDRTEPGSQLLIERSSGPGGTRLETRWQGLIEDRLAWAFAHDSLDSPHLPAGETKNLYH